MERRFLEPVGGNERLAEWKRLAEERRLAEEKRVELYGRVRYAVKIQGMSRREAARVFGVDRRTVDKMLAFPAPPG